MWTYMKEFRRVQKVGHSTLSISLPAEWAKRKGLKRGSSLFFYEENDGSLRLHIEPKTSEEEVYVIDADRYEEPATLARIVVGNYVLGRNIIKIVSAQRLKREQIEIIRVTTQRLLGIGIVEESEKHLLLQSSINPASFPLSTMIKRLHTVISTMFREVREGLRDRDLELVKDALSREHEADTTYWLINRLLSSAQQSWPVAREIGISDPLEIIHSGLISRFLEMIGDHSELIAQKCMELEEVWAGLPQSLMNVLDQMNSLAFTMIDKAVESIFVGDVKIASDALKMKDVADMKERDFLEVLQQNEELKSAPVLRSIIWDVKMIVEYCSAMAEISINNVLEKTG
jgi:phosphate uptake regulator